jgi:hypothetical protein
MPSDPTSQNALIVLAAAASIQTLLLIGMAVAAVVWWRRASGELERRYQELSARIDSAVAPMRQAADAVQHAASRTSSMVDRAGDVAGAARSLVTLPTNLFAAGAATVAGMILKRYMRRDSP